MGIQLRECQKVAVRKLQTGNILCGGVGSGKSRTALAYYYKEEGGDIDSKQFKPLKKGIRDLYIITTARKRDTMEWESEMAPFLLSTKPDICAYGNKVVVDSWNNIRKYVGVKGAFFIFDEQRVVGYGAWTKAFLKICKGNDWILLSATPGDKWEDYIPVFIANGFFRNKSEFNQNHLVYSPYSNFPKVINYMNTGRLMRLRKKILVNIEMLRETVQHHENVDVNYDISAYKDICRLRWNPFKDEPIENASEYCYCLRKVVNSDVSRQVALLEILEEHPKAIIFYNFDYELEILRNLGYMEGTEVAEWNGHLHQPIPEGSKWVYLVQYNAGAEGWNCITTDTIIFWSQNYSYKVMVQASGRIDRMNTPFTDLYFYHLKSRSGIDLAITKALKQKKKFNEGRFYDG